MALTRVKLRLVIVLGIDQWETHGQVLLTPTHYNIHSLYSPFEKHAVSKHCNCQLFSTCLWSNLVSSPLYICGNRFNFDLDIELLSSNSNQIVSDSSHRRGDGHCLASQTSKLNHDRDLNSGPLQTTFQSPSLLTILAAILPRKLLSFE